MRSKMLIDARKAHPQTVEVDGWDRDLFYDGASLITEYSAAGVPDPVKIRSAATKHPPNLPALVNVESWEPEDPRYIELVDLWREHSQIRFAYWAVLPIRNYWDVIHGGKREKGWREANAQFARGQAARGKADERGLADVVDFVIPSLYTFHKSQNSAFDHDSLWFDRYAPKTVEVAKGWNKLVVPCIWPRYHSEPGRPYLGDDLLARQIEWCLENADGCVLWDSWSFEKDNPVFDVTSRVMESFV